MFRFLNGGAQSDFTTAGRRSRNARAGPHLEGLAVSTGNFQSLDIYRDLGQTLDGVAGRLAPAGTAPKRKGTSMMTLQVTLADDPVQVAAWLQAFNMHYNGASGSPLAMPPTAPTTGSAWDDAEVQAELDRFKSNWPAYSGRFTELTDGFRALGYIPVLPKRLKPTSVRAYIAFCLPGGQRVFEVNSATAYIAGTERQERLRGTHEWLRESGQTLSCQFDSTDKVKFVLDLARQEFERP